MCGMCHKDIHTHVIYSIEAEADVISTAAAAELIVEPTVVISAAAHRDHLIVISS